MGKSPTISEHERMRRLNGIGVVEMADRTGFSHPYVSGVEAGRILPSVRYKVAAARVLGVPIAVIFPESRGV
jgi:transcriptional regulator with XRE-family HTH domain